jgi:membrane-bound lytic murein transglycosylase D
MKLQASCVFFICLIFDLMKNTQNTLSLLFTLVCATCTALFFIGASHTEDDRIQAEFRQYYKIYSLSLPRNLTFAGEPIPLNDFEVQERYDKELLTNVYWQSQTLLMIKRSSRFFPAISAVLAKNGIPDDFKYLCVAESGLQNVISPAGATGYWQFLDKTGRMYGLEITDEVDERYQLERSTEAACMYFRYAYNLFGSWALAAASYNMGVEGVRRQLQSQNVSNYYDLYLNTETSRYLLRMAALKEIIERPQHYGFNLTPEHLYKPVPVVIVRADRSIPDLAKFARDNGSNYKMLKVLNPWLRKSSLTVAPGKQYYISMAKDRMMLTDLTSRIVNDTIALEQMHTEPAR